MRCNYGDLPIVVDPTTGRAKMVQAAKTALSKVTPARGRGALEKRTLPVPNPVPAPIDVYDSKLEAARATYLGYLVLAKDIKRVVHHPFTVHLSEKRSYTPDNLIEWADGRITIEEVKGSSKQKNARDSITRLHLAAAKLPMFNWRLTMRIRGQWEERVIQ